MPRQKSIKSVCVDSILFFALFALAGHLTINFWERYTIQSELSSMKNSLHTLKDTITNIGKAYDNLHVELKDLVNVVEPVMPYSKLKDPDALRCKTKHNLDRRTRHDIQVQAALAKRNDKMKVGVGTLTDDRVIPVVTRRNKSTGPMAKTAGTNTRNPVTSTGINSDLSNSDTVYNFRNNTKCNHEYHHLKCYRDFENCRRAYHHLRVLETPP